MTLRLTEEQRQSISAEVRGVRCATLLVSAPVYIPHDRALDIACGGQSAKARVVYSSQTGEGAYQLGLRLDQMDNRRSEARISTQLSAKLRIHGTPAAIQVNVVDLSPSGLGLELPSAVPVGAHASIDLVRGVAVGEIRHCAQRWEKYRAGMRLHDFVAKSAAENTFTPSHVIDDLRPLSAFIRSIADLQAKYEMTLLSWLQSATKKKSGL